MELEEFAEQVRRRMLHIMGAAGNNNAARCGEIAAEVCTMAANVKGQARAAVEQSDPERYDLTTLPARSAFDE